jgi:glycosyltransferase involved in cell wall biosynthesis
MVPRNDHEAMASAALRLLDDNDLAVAITRRAREASRKFTWPVVRQQWITLYRELAEDSLKEKGQNGNESQAEDKLPHRVGA